MISPDAQTAKEVTFDQKVSMKSVTQDGNIYNPSGTLSGGSKPSTSGILIKVLELKKVEGLLKDHQSKLESKMSLYNQTTKGSDLKSHQITLLEDQVKESNATHISLAMLNELKKLIIDLKNKQKVLEAANREAEETDQVVELAREEHEAQRKIMQLQPPDPEVPKETRPIEDPMTPGLEGNQGEGAALLDSWTKASVSRGDIVFYNNTTLLNTVVGLHVKRQDTGKDCSRGSRKDFQKGGLCALKRYNTTREERRVSWKYQSGRKCIREDFVLLLNPGRTSGLEGTEAGPAGPSWREATIRKVVKIPKEEELMFDGKGFHQFLDMFEMAAENEGAEDYDKVKQVIFFCKERDLQEEVMEIESWRELDCGKLFKEMKARWGRYRPAPRCTTQELWTSVDGWEKKGGVSSNGDYEEFSYFFDTRLKHLEKEGTFRNEDEACPLLWRAVSKELQEMAKVRLIKGKKMKLSTRKNTTITRSLSHVYFASMDVNVTEQIWGLPGSPIHRWSYQLPFINHFETIHTGPLVSLISHGGLSVGLSLRESL
ncbi:hypothetical protein BY996DRAFT_6585229 [Phakopsora pachyrhizi]|nr:hypothetical protein BY996DRAFT_6585229 [Phakopsora pachyrhizi]